MAQHGSGDSAKRRPLSKKYSIREFVTPRFAHPQAKLDASATKVQAVWRGHKVRDVFARIQRQRSARKREGLAARPGVALFAVDFVAARRRVNAIVPRVDAVDGALAASVDVPRWSRLCTKNRHFGTYH